MQDLIRQEQFELEVLDRLNSKRLLSRLIFCGGTMLRLCFGLNRFSIDLDFRIARDMDINRLYKDLRTYLMQHYSLKDAANKFYTLLFEIKSEDYPRSLKIEIRKEAKKVRTETAIAYSRYSNMQVFLKVVSLQEMMQAKAEAFLDRREIRDIFDMEFLFKKGVGLDMPAETLKKVLEGIYSFSKKDYSVKLGSLLEDDQRGYYISENFKILKTAIRERL